MSGRAPPAPASDAAALLAAPLLLAATIVSATRGMTSRSLPPVRTYTLAVNPTALYRGWLPPPAAAAAAADGDGSGSAAPPLRFFFSVRQDAAPRLPAAGDAVLLTAHPLPPPPPGGGADVDADAAADGVCAAPITGIAVIRATAEATAAAAGVATIPYGWVPAAAAGGGGPDLASLADVSAPLRCPFAGGTPAVPGGGGAARACAPTGRPAAVAILRTDDGGAGGRGPAGPPAPPGSVRLAVAAVPPPVAHKYRNPDGDGPWSVTLTNDGAAAVALPAVPVAVTPHRLRRPSRVVLWSAAVTVVAEGGVYALPPPAGGEEAAAIAAVAAGTDGAHVEALVLGAGESATVTVNVLRCGEVEWPKGGWRVNFTVGVGGLTGAGGLYYLDTWHDKLRAEVAPVAPAYKL
ncbi:hypothetical protein BU14_0333s0005 [Porphyra umbilicalis]|uniref:Uncharacterized protein n=1 Tax=Porphyra umbilicalis TaxID=2786 RepID=A0A1X6NYM8_PORUM|nr:hypothetical protein BU14_0333s0005 [Porphyra umbilicalis]|eukprot:OSX73616.1 hypothetical protein BU14_0333s0005 [Porphyra umbilicalis]